VSAALAPRAEPRSRPKVLVLFPYGWSIRNYLRTPFLDKLSEGCLVTAALRVCEEPLLAEFASRSAQVVRLPPGDVGRGAHLMEVLMNLAHEHRRPQQVLRERRARLLGAGPLSRRLGLSLLDGAGWLVSRTAFRAGDRLESWLALRSLRGTDAQRLLDETRPDVVFSTAPSLPSDTAVARLARARGTPTAAAVLSWDNLSSKTRMAVTFDRYFVWSEAMARDLLAYYPAVDRRRIAITGTPQFDDHPAAEGLSREELCAALGLDPARPIVAYTSSTARLLPGEEWIVQQLADAIDAGRIPGAPQVLVRLHPYDEGARFSELARRGVRVVRPWAFHAADPSWSNPSARDMQIMRATLRHTAVNVNFFSTMTLDFARVDRPVVNLAIETPASRAAGIDVAAFYRYQHYQPVLEERAMRLVHSIDQLCDAISLYLRDPSLDGAGRKRLVERLCGPGDGCAAERIAGELFDLARARAGRR